MNYVAIWIQGSGKWTQGRILVENHGFELYESGWALRIVAEKDTELGRFVKAQMEAWEQLSPAILEDVLKDTVENVKSENVIFDWFIRNLWNKESFDRIVWNYMAIFFDLPKELAIERLTVRMYDPKTWETFMPWTTHNPVSGNKLEKRKDDNIDAIMKRIDQFFEFTIPAINELEKEGKLIKINANQAPEEVTKEILSKLNLN